MSWITGNLRKQYDEVCALIDTVTTPQQFYAVCDTINSGQYDFDVVATAREDKQFYNSAQFYIRP